MCETEISGQAFTYCPLGTALVSAVPRRPKLAHNLECLLAWRPFWGTGRKILEIGDRLQRRPEASMGETAKWWNGVTPDYLTAMSGKLHPGALKYYDEKSIKVPDTLR